MQKEEETVVRVLFFDTDDSPVGSQEYALTQTFQAGEQIEYDGGIYEILESGAQRADTGAYIYEAQKV